MTVEITIRRAEERDVPALGRLGASLDANALRVR